MVGVSRPPATVSGLDVDANLDMGAYDLLTDDIKESTGAHGVDVDGLVCKDDIPNVKAGSILLASADTEREDSNSGGYTLRKEIEVHTSGVFTTSFKHHYNGGGSASKARIYKNGAAYGAIIDVDGAAYGAAETADLAFDVGDLVQLYTLGAGVGHECVIKEFRLYVNRIISGTVNTD